MLSVGGPRVVFERHGRCIAKQAPLVGDCCQGSSCKPQWCAPDVECPRCKGLFCRHHYGLHLRRFAVPRDSWRSVRRRYASQRARFIQDHGPNAFQAMPVVVGSVCKTPSGRRATAPCGYETGLCQGDEHGCPRCKFTFCSKHFRSHQYSFAMPRRLLLKLLDTYSKQLDEVAARRIKHIYIRLPPARQWA